MGDTSIEWTDYTWNPVSGCTKVSQGCKHCYAERVFPRAYAKSVMRPIMAFPHDSARGSKHVPAERKRVFTDVVCHPDRLLDTWRMVRGRRIFVNSMSDLFHEDVPFEFIAQVFWIMSLTPRHTYQVLTKRPQRMLDFFEWARDGHDENNAFFCDIRIHTEGQKIGAEWKPATKTRGGYDTCGPGWPYYNVWLGVSAEDQETFDERTQLLLHAPAAVRWVSLEPLLGPIAIRDFVLERLDWVVVGGESGHGARPMDPAWARALRDRCTANGVPFLFKQWGEWAPTPTPESSLFKVGKKAAGRALDGVTWDEYPTMKGTA